MLEQNFINLCSYGIVVIVKANQIDLDLLKLLSPEKRMILKNFVVFLFISRFLNVFRMTPNICKPD